MHSRARPASRIVGMRGEARAGSSKRGTGVLGWVAVFACRLTTARLRKVAATRCSCGGDHVAICVVLRLTGVLVMIGIGGGDDT